MESSSIPDLRKIPQSFNRAFANEQAATIFMATLVGIFAGCGAYCYRMLIRAFKWVSFGHVMSVDHLHSLSPWVILLAPAIGAFLVGIIGLFAHEVRGEGVPRIMEAMVVRGGRIRKRLVIWGTLASSLTIGTGGSAGQEGPIVQIGSAIGAALATLFRVNREKVKILVACGAAGGIAAVFNAPIGGAMFALEIILGGDLVLATFSPVLISAVAGTVVSRALLGDSTHEITVPHYDLVTVWELGFYVILGLACAALGILFIRTYYKIEDFFDRIPLKGKWAPVLTGLGGLAVGAMALAAPQILGPYAYEVVDQAVDGKIHLSQALLLVPLKLVATCVTLGSGASGGTFAPSLFMGALLGSGLGSVVHGLFPHITAEVGAYGVVGMAAMVAGVIQAPLTAMMLVFELTDSYTIILPLMFSCVISSFVISHVIGGSMYSERLRRRGIDLKAGRNVNVLKELRVRDAMIQEFRTLPESMTFEDLLKILPETRHTTSFPVVTRDGNLSGILSFSDFQSIVFEKGLEHLVIVKELATKKVITVFPDYTLQEALERMSDKDVAHAPVVDPRAPQHVIGMLSRRDIINAYNRALMKVQLHAGPDEVSSVQPG